MLQIIRILSVYTFIAQETNAHFIKRHSKLIAHMWWSVHTTVHKEIILKHISDLR